MKTFTRRPVQVVQADVATLLQRNLTLHKSFPFRLGIDFPKNFAAFLNISTNQSYCAWLQEHSQAEGLYAELYRSLHAADGIGKMLKDIQSFPHAWNICSHDLLHLDMFSQIHSFILRWFTSDQVWRKEATPGELKALRTQASQLLADVLTPITNFPCSLLRYEAES